MPRWLGVVFELRCAQTRPGESVQVVGSRPELGGWRPLREDGEEEVRSLRTCPLMYPRWSSRAAVWLPLEPGQGTLRLEYKFVRGVLGEEAAAWEAKIPNRRVCLPAEGGGGVWLVSHARWNCARESPQLTRLSPEELSGLRCSLAADFGTPEPRPARPRRAEPAPGRPLPPQAGELGLRTRGAPPAWERFFLSPRAADPDAPDAGGSRWEIEAEFSANFSTPAGGLCRERLAADEDGSQALGLRLENERLRAALSGARQQIELLRLERSTLRQKLGAAPLGRRKTFSEAAEELLQEPQEEPQASGDAAH